VCVCVRARARMHVRMCMCARARVCVCVCVCVSGYVQDRQGLINVIVQLVRVCACAGACVHMFMYVSVRVFVYDCCTCYITWPYAIARVIMCIQFSLHASMCSSACVYLL
jgi:hypothetical protein